MSAIETWAASITVGQLDNDPYPIYARMRREAPVCFVPAVGLLFLPWVVETKDRILAD